MAAANVRSENLTALISVLGGISEDDCNLLIEEYNTADPQEISEAVFESMASSNFDTVSDLVWHIRQNPCFGVKRSQSLREKNSNATDSWCLARSKSSNTINKHANSLPVTPQQRPSSAAGQMIAQTAMPFSGTRYPICVVRSPKNFDIETLRLYLSKYVHDNDLRSIFYDVFEKRSPKLLILMRGASGSGKSTLALVLWSISEKGEICSADHFFINRQGQYNFKREQLGEAHGSCRTKCQNAMQRGDSPVIIDNTNTRIDEMMPYVQLAIEHNYDIRIVEPKTDWKRKANILAQKTVHGVPKRSIQDQLDRFENTTEKAMVDRVLQQQRPRYSTYNPVRNLEWGSTELDGVDDWLGVSPSYTTVSPPVFTTTVPNPMVSNNFQPMMTPTTMKPSPNHARTPQPQPLFNFPAPRTPTHSSLGSQPNVVPAVSKSSSYFPMGSKHVATNLPQSSWTDAPTTTPTSPTMISDWVPDIKAGNGNGNGKSQRSKKSGKQKTNTNASTGATQSIAASNEFVDPAHVAFEKLCKLFPSAARDEVEKIFNLYEGDVELCASALLDQGIAFNELGNLEEGGEMDQRVPSSNGSPPSMSQVEAPEENDDDGWEQPETLPSSLNNIAKNYNFETYDDKAFPLLYQGSFDDVATSSSTSGGDASVTEDDGDYFDMVLPDDFAKALLTAFGHPDDEARVLSKEERTIKVLPDIAFELYKGLYLNMHRAETEGARADSEETTRSNTPTYDDEFNEIAISISQMELETKSGDPKLSSIIDIESKLSVQTQESLKKYTAPNRTMAQNVNFCLLKQRYPHIEAAVIDEIYCQYQLDMNKTVAFLDEMYTQSPQADAQPSTSGGAYQTEEQWHLRYNPKDVKLYSPTELKSITRNYEELESLWMSHMEKIKDYHQKCKNSQGSTSQIKSFYVCEAKKISDSMKRLSEELQYYKAITQNAKHKNDQILDLHGLKVNGAMRVLKEFLQFKEEEFLNIGVPKMILLIITGQGKHSRNGCPVLQPAVKNFLAQRNYKYHSSKPGTYTVILTRGTVARRK
ncbi:unnamed protein product [Orchesella dallaii]|uniref:Smr domain-containing protein n=1 Tax=Orchesella dallaii TaxID=48710 RepID=A0ABP1PXZ0_9HEXA